MDLRSDFISEVKGIIEQSRERAIRSVDHIRVRMYWELGRKIVEEEQLGKERAEYGKYLIKNLAKQLKVIYGSGFSYRQLQMAKKLYLTYPIVQTLSAQFILSYC